MGEKEGAGPSFNTAIPVPHPTILLCTSVHTFASVKQMNVQHAVTPELMFEVAKVPTQQSFMLLAGFMSPARVKTMTDADAKVSVVAGTPSTVRKV